RERPVDVPLEELSEAAVLYVLRLPVDLSVVVDDVGDLLRRPDEPAPAGVLDEGVRVAAPAEGVVVPVDLLFLEESARPEVADDVAVRFPAEAPGEVRDFGGEGAIGEHELQKAELRILADAEVVLAEG